MNVVELRAARFASVGFVFRELWTPGHSQLDDLGVIATALIAQSEFAGIRCDRAVHDATVGTIRKGVWKLR